MSPDTIGFLLTGSPHRRSPTRSPIGEIDSQGRRPERQVVGHPMLAGMRGDDETACGGGADTLSGGRGDYTLHGGP